MNVDQLLGEFEDRLKKDGRGRGSIDTHIRRVSTYIRWCGTNGYNPLQQATCKAFLKSRETRDCELSTIEAYSYSIRTFLRVML